MVALNRAVAVSMVDGPEPGLRLLDRLAGDENMQRLHLYHSARGHLLAQLGRRADAAAAYGRAVELVGTAAEAAHLRERLHELQAPG